MGEGITASSTGELPPEERQLGLPTVEVKQDGSTQAYAIVTAEQARQLGDLSNEEVADPTLIDDEHEATRNLLLSLRDRGDVYALVMPGVNEEGKELPARFMRLDSDDYGTTLRAGTEEEHGLPNAAGMYDAWQTAVQHPAGKAATNVDPQTVVSASGYKISDEVAPEDAAATSIDVEGNVQRFAEDVERASTALGNIETQLQTITELDTVDSSVLGQYKSELDALLYQLADKASSGPWQANYLHGYTELRESITDFIDRACVMVTEVEQRQAGIDQTLMSLEPYEARRGMFITSNEANIGKIVDSAETLLMPLKVARDFSMLRFRLNGAINVTNDRYVAVGDALEVLQALQLELTEEASKSDMHGTVAMEAMKDLAFWQTRLLELERDMEEDENSKGERDIARSWEDALT